MIYYGDESYGADGGWLYNTFDVAPDGDDDCVKLWSHVLVDKLRDSEIQKPGQVSHINSSYQLLPRGFLLLMEETLSSWDI